MPYRKKELKNMRRERKKLFLIEFLSVDAPLVVVDKREDKQQRYIRDYIRNKGYEIAAIKRRCGLNQHNINIMWELMCDEIAKKHADGIIVSNMTSVAANEVDAYKKAGQVASAGGVLVSVDEGELSMPIKYNESLRKDEFREVWDSELR